MRRAKLPNLSCCHTKQLNNKGPSDWPGECLTSNRGAESVRKKCRDWRSQNDKQ